MRSPAPPPGPGRPSGGLPLPSGTRSAADAVGTNSVLESLARRIQGSQARLAAVLPLLPAAMHPHLVAGPLDDEGWTLLARNQAVAVKLRQMQPALQNRLRQQGWAAPALRVKLLLERP